MAAAFLLVVSFCPPLSHQSLGRTAKSVTKEKLMAYVPGDVILGGLFPMHENNISRREQPCGAIKEEKGIQVREGMMTS